ncbi:MAG: hypothetical protein CSA07_00215 [Bacteroidia bacterium]|nr:MAG: hypothetical protein CSA07_00215 [Bacteroidia bacterium]
MRRLLTLCALLLCIALHAQNRAEPWSALLRRGDSLQESADSLRTRLNALKGRLWDARTAQDRKRLEASMEPIRNRMLRDQRAADELYIRASRMKQDHLLGRRPSRPSSRRSTQARSTQAKAAELYQSQLASTVFQPSEIQTLKDIAHKDAQRDRDLQAVAQTLNEIRSLLQDSSQTIAQIAKEEARAEKEAKAVAQKYAAPTATQLAIYTQCLAVAQMKSQRNAHQQVSEAKTEAHKYQRMALTLRSNSTLQSEGQISFQALCLDLLAIRHLQLAYGYTWNLSNYCAQTHDRIRQLKHILHIEVDTPPSAPPKFNHLPPEETRVKAPIVDQPQTQGLQLLPPPVYTSENPVPADQPHPAGVMYSLQLGAYSQPVDPSTFGGLFPVRAETLNGGQITKYYAGEFRRRAEIGDGKQIAAAGGFPDAFPVAWLDGRSISITRAQALEGQQTSRPARAQETSGGSFYVRIGVFPHEMPADLARTISHLAPGKALSASPDPGGTAYSVGPFPSYQAAENLRANLQASGQTEARVEPSVVQ